MALQPTAIRPLSPMEHFSSTRHHLGIYRCVTITCRYSFSSPPSQQNHPIFPALASVIAAHPALRVGILGQDTNAASFSHIPEIDLRKQVEFRSIPGGDAYEQGLTAIQGWCDDQLWQDVETRPPWRIIVVTADAGAEFEDIVFAWHHSLMDGTAGREFHENLLRAFNSLPTPSPEPVYTLSFPDPPTLPEPQEEAIPFRNSTLWMARTLWSALGPTWLKSTNPPIWAGRCVDFSQPHRTQVRAIDIPSEVVGSLLKACRAHNASITSLFHALCLASFATRVDVEPGLGFAASTPISLRPYLSPTVNPSTRDSLRNLITSITHEFLSSTVRSFRAPDRDLDALIWQSAEAIKAEILKKTNTLPANDIVSLTKHITDWFQHWANKDGQLRDATWEVSNVGVVNQAEAQGQRKITRILFTNGAMIAGPAVGVEVGSVKGGLLTLGVSWNQGVVPDELVQGLVEDLGRFCKNLHETGKFVNSRLQ